MRDEARSQHAVQSPAIDRYQTPAWLERSFVLPLTQPEASDVPSQPVPRHDDDPGRIPEPRVIERLEPDTIGLPMQPAPIKFVRPPSDDIDFARVVRRADLCLLAGRLSWAATGLAGLALIVFLLLSSVVALALVIAFALASLVAFAVRMRLSRAAIPRLQR
jgi:hypothetical protein